MECKALVHNEMTQVTDVIRFAGTDLSVPKKSTNEFVPTIFKNWTLECEALASQNGKIESVFCVR